MLLFLASQAFAIPYGPGLLERSRMATARGAPPQPTACTAINASLLSDITEPPYPALKHHYAGYLSVSNGSASALGYIFVGAQNANSAQELANKPLILWLNGGPGSSSQLGNFFELGPVRLLSEDNGKFKLANNTQAWSNEYSVLFVDQPVGTGLSVNASEKECPSSVQQSTEQLYYALTQLVRSNGSCFGPAHLNVSMSKAPFFIFGQSYAGKYAPALGSYFLKKGQDAPLQLKGVAVGDGFTDPRSIVLEMPQFASSMGFLGIAERQLVERAALLSASQISKGRFSEARDSFYLVLESIMNFSGGVNPYDIRLFEDNTDDDALEHFLNSPAVVKAFGLNPANPYHASSDVLFDRFREDFMKDGLAWVEDILSAKLPLMVYNGQVDLIVETPGTLRWVEQLGNVSKGWPEMDLEPYRNSKKAVIGYKKEAGKLRYVLVNQAGHLVPMDQPENAKFLLDDFVAWALKPTEETTL